MNKNISENKKIKYSLDDAFHIINSILIDEREKYENIINTMNQKIKELKLEIEQLKEENKIYKNKLFNFQNQFYSLSKTFYHLNEIPGKNYIKSNLETSNHKKEGINKIIPNEISQKINNSENLEINNNFINNDLNNFKKSKINLNNSIKQQLFNTKLIKKLNSFNLKNEKNIPKFYNNKINIPFKIVKKNNENNNTQEDYSQSFNELNDNFFREQNKTISNFNNERKIFLNYDIQNNTNKKENSQKEKFNIIERRIKNMKNGLNIHKAGRNKINNDSTEFFKAKYDTYSVINRANLLNFE